MKRITIIAAIAFAGLASFTGCNSPAQKVENAKDNVEQAQEDLDKANLEYRAEVENFRAEIAERVLSNEQRITLLKAKIAQEKYSTRVLFEKKVAELEAKNREMQKRLVEYKVDEKDKWESFKAEFNHDMNELGNALKDFFNKK